MENIELLFKTLSEQGWSCHEPLWGGWAAVYATDYGSAQAHYYNEDEEKLYADMGVGGDLEFETEEEYKSFSTAVHHMYIAVKDAQDVASELGLALEW